MKWILNLIKKIKMEIAYRKKLKKAKEEDPFIYKQEKIMLAKIWELLCWPYKEYKFRKKMKQLRKKDPYIYK